jgi:tetratricopeptide (TPR) repeat protein
MRIVFPDNNTHIIYELEERADKLRWSKSSEDQNQAVVIYTRILSLITPGSMQWYNRSSYLCQRGITYRNLGNYGAALEDFNQGLQIEQERGYQYTITVFQKYIDETLEQIHAGSPDKKAQIALNKKWWQFWKEADTRKDIGLTMMNDADEKEMQCPECSQMIPVNSVRCRKCGNRFF